MASLSRNVRLSCVCAMGCIFFKGLLLSASLSGNGGTIQNIFFLHIFGIFSSSSSPPETVPLFFFSFFSLLFSYHRHHKKIKKINKKGGFLGISATIRTRGEIQCLPYVGFFTFVTWHTLPKMGPYHTYVVLFCHVWLNLNKQISETSTCKISTFNTL